jgi:hypothetical protein
MESTTEQKTEFLKAVEEMLAEMREERKAFPRRNESHARKNDGQVGHAHRERTIACQETTMNVWNARNQPQWTWNQKQSIGRSSRRKSR